MPTQSGGHGTPLFWNEVPGACTSTAQRPSTPYSVPCTLYDPPARQETTCMRNLTLILMAALLPTTAAAQDEDARLAKFFRSYLDEEIRQRPVEGTRLGDPRFEDRLDDVSAKTRA